MKQITKAAWQRVLEKACDIANASSADDHVLGEVYKAQMLNLLDELEEEFGLHPEILDTRADYLDDPVVRRALYMRALEIARDRRDQEEVEVILQSLRDLERDIMTDAESGAQK